MRPSLPFLLLVALGPFGPVSAADHDMDLTARLAANTAALQATFGTDDAVREAELYGQRHRILLAMRAAKPPSSEPPRIYRGRLTSRFGGEIMLDREDGTGISMNVGRIQHPHVRTAFEALHIGDQVELVFTHEPHLYFDDYVYELTRVRQFAPGKQTAVLLKQSIESDGLFEESLVQLHPATAGYYHLLGSVRNKLDTSIRFHGREGVSLSLRQGERDLAYEVLQADADIAAGEIGIIHLRIPKTEVQGARKIVRLGMVSTYNGFFFGGSVELRDEAE